MTNKVAKCVSEMCFWRALKSRKLHIKYFTLFSNIAYDNFRFLSPRTEQLNHHGDCNQLRSKLFVGLSSAGLLQAVAEIRFGCRRPRKASCPSLGPPRSPSSPTSRTCSLDRPQVERRGLGDRPLDLLVSGQHLVHRTESHHLGLHSGFPVYDLGQQNLAWNSSRKAHGRVSLDPSPTWSVQCSRTCPVFSNGPNKNCFWLVYS